MSQSSKEYPPIPSTFFQLSSTKMLGVFDHHVSQELSHMLIFFSYYLTTTQMKAFLKPSKYITCTIFSILQIRIKKGSTQKMGILNFKKINIPFVPSFLSF